MKSKKFFPKIALLFLFLSFFLNVKPISAATTYTLSKDRKSIISSDDKRFEIVPDAACGLETNGQPTPNCEQGKSVSFKGPWSYSHRYWITFSGLSNLNTITKTEIPATLYHFHWDFIFPDTEPSQINVMVTDPDVSTPLPAMPVYQWREGTPPTITSPEGKVFESEKAEGSTTYLPWYYKNKGDGSTVSSFDLGLNWLLKTPDGKEQSVIVSGAPGSEFVDVKITVYKEEEKTGNELEGVNCIFTENTGFMNAWTNGTNSSGICAVNGYFKYSLTVSVKVDGLVEGDATQKWVGNTSLTFNRDGSIATGKPIIVAQKEPILGVDPFTKAVNSAIKFISETLGKAIGGMLGWIDWELKDGTNDFSSNDTLKDVSLQMRNVALGLLTLVLLLVAFANILNLPVADYGLARIIPKIIISILMAFFSYLIAIFILEIANALQTFIIEGFTDAGTFAPQVTSGKSALESVFGSNPAESYLLAEHMKWQAVLLIIIMLGMVLVTGWLLLVLVIRKAVLLLLIAVAPLAFILNILPFTSKYYKEWWANFWKWAFMGVPIAVLYYLSFVFLSTGFLGAKFQSNGAELSGNYEQWTYLIAATVLIFMAAGIPLKMGDKVYDGIKNFGGKAAKMTGLKDRWEGYRSTRSSYSKQKATDDVMRVRNTLNKKGYLGELAAGTRGVFGKDQDIATRVERELVSKYDQKQLEEELGKVTRGGTINLGSPRSVALLEKIAGEIHASTLSDETKKALTAAVVQGSGLTPANQSLQTVARKLEGNPNKDASQTLYLHAMEGNAATGVAPYAATLGAAFLELEKAAVKKASGKSPIEFGKDDDKTTEHGRHSVDLGTATLATNAIGQRTSFFNGPNAQENKKVYDQKVSPKTKQEHEESGYIFH